jgi:putative nucleotidyltransferase with HDIG domain
VGDTVSGNDEDFVTVRPNGVIPNVKSFFDLFLRLGSGKYVRLVNSGQKPDMAQLQKYQSRGVKLFHIRKDIQANYVQYCEQIATTLISAKNVPPEVKVGSALNQGQEAYGLIRAQGVSDENMVYAGGFVQNMGKVVKDYNLVANDALSRFLSKVSSYEHNTRIAAMAGMLARALDLSSESTVQIVGMAGLLHDVGLMKLGMDEGSGERADDMDAGEFDRYASHPEVGAKLLASLKRFDPTVIQAVQQHHVRRDGIGFPDPSTFASINICSEVLGIVDCYDYLIRAKIKDPSLDLRAAMEESFEGYSRPIVQAFKSVFMPKARK